MSPPGHPGTSLTLHVALPISRRSFENILLILDEVNLSLIGGTARPEDGQQTHAVALEAIEEIVRDLEDNAFTEEVSDKSAVQAREAWQICQRRTKVAREQLRAVCDLLE